MQGKTSIKEKPLQVSHTPNKAIHYKRSLQSRTKSLLPKGSTTLIDELIVVTHSQLLECLNLSYENPFTNNTNVFMIKTSNRL